MLELRWRAAGRRNEGEDGSAGVDAGHARPPQQFNIAMRNWGGANTGELERVEGR